MTEVPVPIIADRYELVRPLGRGSFAQTFLARDARLDRHVALKVLHPRVIRDWKAYELFDREAAVLRELRHHGIPAVYETFRAQHDGADAAFLVMEYIEGISLADMIGQRRHLDTADVLHLFLELLGVVDYLHTRLPPILHRDIKPANVIVRPDGTPALVDFGAVRNVFLNPHDSGSTIVGTYGYMPYEQLMGQASPASDLYALASTFLHLVTGRAPPEFMSTAGRLEVPDSLPCGAPLRSVLARLLAAAPGDRLPSARAARAALLDGVNATAPPLSPLAPPAALAPASAAPFVHLPATPRPLEGDTAALLKRVLFTPGQLMEPDTKPGSGWSFADVFVVVLASLATIGILPAVFWSHHLSRKKRLKRFFARGVTTTARVLDMVREDIGFRSTLHRVRYEFEVDGRRLRDSDLVLPTIAERWDPGTMIQVLYLPDSYDSVIISTS